MNVPEVYGGAGLNTLDWMLEEEQFGYTTDILIRRAFENVYDILFEGTQEQVELWLLPFVRGERVFSVAFTEPEPGQSKTQEDGASVGRSTSYQTGPSPIFSSSQQSPTRNRGTMGFPLSSLIKTPLG